ncbi:DUF1553 domain-containing protein [Rhodopirellula baltica]
MDSKIKEWVAALTASLACVSACAGDDALNAESHFRDRVATIFSQRCLSCHGSESPEGDFSLHDASSFFAGGHIESGDADASHLMELITPKDGQAEMPQDADPLSPADLNAIRQWIDEGAIWPADVVLQEASVNDFGWWSHQPMVQPEVPIVSDPWATSPIDRFILRRLNEEGLKPNPPANRRELIRRLTFDLIGLPPTPEEVADFVSDQDPLAYEKLVDRLLGSKHYGERWARHWLDVVKYADSNGYDKDKLRPNAWPYRDYVIRSLNQGKTYARFVREQIAGDVLYPGDPDGIAALGFIAAGPWDFIGHVEVSESKQDGKVARNLDRDDMVSGALNTFCSVTVQCARCHNHKFDPITQEQYYGLQAVFSALDRADRSFDIQPETAEQREILNARLGQLITQRNELEQRIQSAGGAELTDLLERIESLRSKSEAVSYPEYGYHSELASTPDSKKWVEVQLDAEVPASRIILRPCNDNYNNIGAGFGFPLRFKIESADDAGVWTTIADKTGADFPNPQHDAVEFALSGQRVRRVRVTATRLAERKADYIFALAELQIMVGDDHVGIGAKVIAKDSIEAPVRWQRQNLTDNKWPEENEAETLQSLAEAEQRRKEILCAVTTPEMTRQLKDISTEETVVRQKLDGLPPQQVVYAAATDFTPQGNFKPTGGIPREVFVLHRGEVSLPGEKAVPGVIPLANSDRWQFDSELDESQRRVQLAEWLTDRQHPLVWRSIVNRIWQYHFGEGIVATPNDFGRMGAEPTHPKLLDWLAVEFRDGGQSWKRLHRLIVTSNTYKQSSAMHPEHSAIDGGNRFLWRANRRRLSAEEIRDSVLAVSGVLDHRMGGPGYYLFELEKTAHSPHFQYHKFDPAKKESHRRSVYRFIARSQPNPFLTTLDCADSSQSTPRRNETLTSLQALSLMNNKFSLAMAKEFAKRLISERPDLPAQVELAFELLVQRKPSDAEASELMAYAQDYGLENMCRILFNLSEFVFVD